MKEKKIEKEESPQTETSEAKSQKDVKLEHEPLHEALNFIFNKFVPFNQNKTLIGTSEHVRVSYGNYVYLVEGALGRDAMTITIKERPETTVGR